MTIVLASETTSPATLEILSLEDLAEIANRSHSDVRRALMGVFQHIFCAGDALNEARSRFSSGKEWLAWADQNFPPGANVAYDYMRVAYYKDQLPQEAMQPQVGPTGKIYQPTLTTAKNALKGLPAIRDPGAWAHKFNRQEAQRLRDEGMTFNEIARQLSVSERSVRVALDPSARSKQRAAQRRYQAKRRQERAALADAERKKFAATVGGDLGEAYSLVRKALQHTDAAASSGSYGYQVRRKLSNAINNLYRAEDAIAEALKWNDAA